MSLDPLPYSCYYREQTNSEYFLLSIHLSCSMTPNLGVDTSVDIVSDPLLTPHRAPCLSTGYSIIIPEIVLLPGQWPPLCGQSHTGCLCRSWRKQKSTYSILTKTHLPANILVDVSFVSGASWTGFLDCVFSGQFESILSGNPGHEAGRVCGNHRVLAC